MTGVEVGGIVRVLALFELVVLGMGMTTSRELSFSNSSRCFWSFSSLRLCPGGFIPPAPSSAPGWEYASEEISAIEVRALEAAVRVGRDLRRREAGPGGTAGRGLLCALGGGAVVYVQVAPEEVVPEGRSSTRGGIV